MELNSRVLEKDRKKSLIIVGILLILNVIISVFFYMEVVKYSTELENIAVSISNYAVQFVSWVLGWFGM